MNTYTITWRSRGLPVRVATATVASVVRAIKTAEEISNRTDTWDTITIEDDESYDEDNEMYLTVAYGHRRTQPHDIAWFLT